MTENLKPFFDDESIKPVKLTDWMEWASCKPGAPHNVVLPMIQRGSVWPPHKLLDLWDTLLRRMPVGAMMASEVAGESVKVLGEPDTRGAKAGDIGLIDGQQRTLAMLAGWPQGLQNPLRPVAVWVDMTDRPQGEYGFRLWATTKSQPFGYSRASVGGQPLSKLERKKLRLANLAFHPITGKIDAPTLWSQPDFMPWESRFAIPLTELIKHKSALLEFVKTRLADYKKVLESRSRLGGGSEAEKEAAQYFVKKLSELPDEAELKKRIPAFEKALEKVFACEFPVIHVRQESFADDDQFSEIDTDPPLAILFKRVGTGGEPLSNSDYVYSVIKHHAPQVHGLVEKLLEDAEIRAVYTPTTLVMSAVRMTMLSLDSAEIHGKKITDSAKLDKAAFARLVRNHRAFIEQFEKDIRPDGVFATRLKRVLNGMGYNSAEFKTGLPKQALCLVPIPLLETILAWYTLQAPSADAEALKPSRLPMVRFALQGNLCVLDHAQASEVAIKALKEGAITNSDIFPDQALMNELCKGEKATAYALPSPDTLRGISVMSMKCADEAAQNSGAINTTWRLTDTPEQSTGLRGWTRFVAMDEADKKHAEIYKRWWNQKGGHVHPMLLWLQRDYVSKKFADELALAGMDEETPYDFDHILPSAQWAYWTGAVGENKFISFPLENVDGKTQDNTGHWHIGNSIGNIHVLESSDNRSLGDTSVSVKLANDELFRNAQIPTGGRATWLAASGEAGKHRHWDWPRARAFQAAVEQRTFSLYKAFYDDLQCGQASID